MVGKGSKSTRRIEAEMPVESQGRGEDDNLLLENDHHKGEAKQQVSSPRVSLLKRVKRLNKCCLPNQTLRLSLFSYKKAIVKC